MTYLPRVLDSQLESSLTQLPAVAVDGPKAVGKSATASRFAQTVLRLDVPEELALLEADRQRINQLTPPVLIDEWQLDPPIWDAVRRSVDDDRTPGRFILTGSANPRDSKIHTGAGRIVRMRMRPMSIAERQLDQSTVSLQSLIAGEANEISGETGIRLTNYVEEILASGFPGIRMSSPATYVAQLDSYLEYALTREVPALGSVVRRPVALLEWLRAYAAATSTTTSLESIADAVAKNVRPTRATILDYREALAQLWLLDEIPGWVPTGNELTKVAQAPKHQLADPALAARLLRVTKDSLLDASSRAEQNASYRKFRKGPLLGRLFESLVTLSVRVYAQQSAATVCHLRTYRGEREVDLILEAPDGRILAIEVKLGADVDNGDVRHLNWLKGKIPDQVVDRVVITTGTHAYRRTDGVAVVPLALLGM